MLWFNVFKSDPGGVALLVNSYYADFPTALHANNEGACVSLLEYDLAWSGNTSQALLVTMQPAQLGNQRATSETYIYAPYRHYDRGQQPINDPIPWRWCLGTKLWAPGNRRAYHHYHCAISREMIDYGLQGDCVLKLPPNYRDLQNGRFGRYGGDYLSWLHYGTGSATPGNPLDFVKVDNVTVNGVTITDAARRRQGLMFNAGNAWQKQVIGICQSASYAYSDSWDERGLEKGDYIDARIRTRTMDVMGAALGVAQTFEENQKNEQGDTMNGGEGWRVRYGPTGGSLTNLYQTWEKQYEDDLKRLQKYQTQTDVSGEPYFHREDAEQWWEAGDDWYQKFASLAMFDFTCIAQDDPKDTSRIDNYTPLYPDLPAHVEGLPRPIRNPQRKHVPGGLT